MSAGTYPSLRAQNVANLTLSLRGGNIAVDDLGRIEALSRVASKCRRMGVCVAEVSGRYLVRGQSGRAPPARIWHPYRLCRSTKAEAGGAGRGGSLHDLDLEPLFKGRTGKGGQYTYGQFRQFL